jgi:hypothetical protein
MQSTTLTAPESRIKSHSISASNIKRRRAMQQSTYITQFNLYIKPNTATLPGRVNMLAKQRWQLFTDTSSQ